MSKYIVTGGAGFIGSALVWGLNERGETDIAIVDDLDNGEKEHNIGHLKYDQQIGIKEFQQKLKVGYFDRDEVKAVFHMGACSSTTEQNWDYLLDNNVEYSKDVIRWCYDQEIHCIYASSAATYGDGSLGYSDDEELFERLQPLNLYGKSKLLVDTWARDGGYLHKVVGLRYFNVFGPNENHKKEMRSVMNKKFVEAKEKGVINLFKSNHPDYKDGEQQRDFIYVKDALAATLFFLDHPDVAGIFNVGTGVAHSWNEVARAIFSALSMAAKIQYIDLPESLKNQYQNYTQADISKLRQVGYSAGFMTLEKSIDEYIRQYLLPHKHIGGQAYS